MFQKETAAAQEQQELSTLQAMLMGVHIGDGDSCFGDSAGGSYLEGAGHVTNGGSGEWSSHKPTGLHAQTDFALCGDETRCLPACAAAAVIQVCALTL